MNIALVYRGRYHVREAFDLEGLAPVIRSAGHRVGLVYDPDAFGVTDNVLQIPPLARMLASSERTVRRIVSQKPDVVIFSVLPGTYAWAREVAAALKKRCDARIVFMGLHPSLAPEHVIANDQVDYVIEGEAEPVVNDLLSAVAGERSITGVGNLWFDEGGERRFTFRAPLADLDSLPLPDKDLFRPYVAHDYSYVAMVSRGCPYRCTFCEETCSKKLYGSDYFRRKQVGTVMRELIAARRRYRFREVIFKDSYLSGNKPWLRELMREYRKHVGVPFKCFCTLLGFDDETARLLKAAGCYNIEFGLQTWNEAIRRNVLARNETNVDATRAFASCARHRLHYDVDHMFELPGESAADHAGAALRYRGLAGLNRVKVHHLVYLPGAEIVEHALRQKIVRPDLRERLAEGMASDFYAASPAVTPADPLVKGYATLYKLLPILPASVVRWFARRDRVKMLRWIPSPAVAALQGLVALRGGDLRFAAYLHDYPRKVWYAAKDATRRSGQDWPLSK